MDKKQELEALKKQEQNAASALSDVRWRIKALQDSMREDDLGIKIGDEVAYFPRARGGNPSKEVRGVLVGFSHYHAKVRLYKVNGQLGEIVRELYGSDEATLRKIGGSHE